MNKKLNFVGIDVSSKELVVAMQIIDNSVQHAVFENTKAGHKKLLKFITKGGCMAKVCLEATGVYHFDLSVALANANNTEVMVVNPKNLKHFGTAIKQRAKTDKIDSMVILNYLLRMQFVKWECPNDNILQIQAASRRLFQLKNQLQQENNRLHANEFRREVGKLVKQSIHKNINHLKKLIDAMQLEISSLIQSVPELKEKYDLLTSIKGFADVSATQILAEVLTLPNGLGPKQWIAFAGLDPKPAESGSSINKPRRLTKNGNQFIRAALYMPAWVAVQRESHVKAYYNKLISEGKSKMCAIVAVMRKLLLAIWGILHSKTEWDGNKFYNLKNA